MPPQSAPNPMSQMILMAIIFAIFYFIVIQPEKKKQKEHKARIAGLKKNDEVITSSGIHGTVVNVKDATVVLRLDENVRVEFEKDAVLTVINKTE